MRKVPLLCGVVVTLVVNAAAAQVPQRFRIEWKTLATVDQPGTETFGGDSATLKSPPSARSQSYSIAIITLISRDSAGGKVWSVVIDSFATGPTDLIKLNAPVSTGAKVSWFTSHEGKLADRQGVPHSGDYELLGMRRLIATFIESSVENLPKARKVDTLSTVLITPAFGSNTIREVREVSDQRVIIADTLTKHSVSQVSTHEGATRTESVTLRTATERFVRGGRGGWMSASISAQTYSIVFDMGAGLTITDLTEVFTLTRIP